MNIGKIKRYGGWNSKSNLRNDYGFIQIIECGSKESPSGDLYFNRHGIVANSYLLKMITGESHPSSFFEGYLISFDVRKDRRSGKFEACNVQLLFELLATTFATNHGVIVDTIKTSHVTPQSLLSKCIPEFIRPSLDKEHFSVIMEALDSPGNKRDFVLTLLKEAENNDQKEKYKTLFEELGVRFGPNIIAIDGCWMKIKDRGFDYSQNHTSTEHEKKSDLTKTQNNGLTLFKEGEIYYIFNYVPKRDHDCASSNDIKIAESIWAFKDGEYRDGFRCAYATFTKYLKLAVKEIAEIAKRIKVHDVALVAAPRSSESKPKTMAKSIKQIVDDLNNDSSISCRFYDESSLLYRSQEVEASHTMTIRTSMDVHIRSINHRTPKCPENSLFIVLDDITTQGNTMLACRNILESSFHSHVMMLAIAKTSARYEYNNSIVKWERGQKHPFYDSNSSLEMLDI